MLTCIICHSTQVCLWECHSFRSLIFGRRIKKKKKKDQSQLGQNMILGPVFLLAANLFFFKKSLLDGYDFILNITFYITFKAQYNTRNHQELVLSQLSLNCNDKLSWFHVDERNVSIRNTYGNLKWSKLQCLQYQPYLSFVPHSALG